VGIQDSRQLRVLGNQTTIIFAAKKILCAPVARNV